MKDKHVYQQLNYAGKNEGCESSEEWVTDKASHDGEQKRGSHEIGDHICWFSRWIMHWLCEVCDKVTGIA